jgi:hypothetical protein
LQCSCIGVPQFAENEHPHMRNSIGLHDRGLGHNIVHVVNRPLSCNPMLFLM